MDETLFKTVFGFLWLSMCAFIAIRAIAYTKIEKLVSKRSSKETLLVFLAVIGMGAVPLVYLTTGWLAPFAFAISAEARLSGAIIYTLGLILLFWVHRTLGRNWSLLLEIRREHMMVTGGPYRFVRHPLYLAFYILAAGQWLLTANWFVGIAGLILWTLFYIARVNNEEKLMLDFFGRQYQEYMERTGRLLPKLK
jgi:protein-S-isoprenylcysteine O-methyltransferase Ste14